MSEVVNAVDGAPTATLPDSKPEAVQAAPEAVQETPQQETVTAESETPTEEHARDEKGRFVQKRINELTRKYHEERREREATAARLQQLESELSSYRNPAPDPSLDPQAYVQHLAREEARALLEGERRQWAQQQEQQRFQSLAQTHVQREEAYAEQHPDYAEAADAFVSLAGSNPALAEVLMSSDHGPAVVHYLGLHLDEAERILSLPVHLQAAQIARIEARVSAPKAKSTTKAPDPVPTLGGSSAVSKDPSKMSYEEYKKHRQGG